MEKLIPRFLTDIISDKNIKSNIETGDLIVDDIMKVLNTYNFDNVIFELEKEGGIARFRDIYNCNRDGYIFDIYFHKMSMVSDNIRFMAGEDSTISDLNRLGLSAINTGQFARSVASKNTSYQNVVGMLSVKEFIINMTELYSDVLTVYSKYYIKLRICMKLSETLNVNFKW